jgi:hypothetical protein
MGLKSNVPGLRRHGGLDEDTKKDFSCTFGYMFCCGRGCAGAAFEIRFKHRQYPKAL